MRNKTVVLLNSGGLDSFLTGKWLELKKFRIYSLYIHWLVDGKVYNPKFLEAAQQTAALINAVDHVAFPLEGNILFGQINKIPDRPACSSTIYYFIAASYAFNIGARYVASGHMFTDKDNRFEEKYFEATNTLFKSHFNAKNYRLKDAKLVNASFMADEMPIELLMPLFKVKNSRDAIIKLGLSLEDIKHTYSCSFIPPCGRCYKCQRWKKLEVDQALRCRP